MTIAPIDIGIVSIYLLATLLLGVFKGRKSLTMRDYTIADKSYTTPIMVAAIFATWVGGESTLGMAEKTFAVGSVFILVFFGSFLNKLLIAQFIAPRMKNFNNVLSVGEMMGTFYGKEARIITGLCAFILCTGTLASQIVSLGYFFQYFVNIPSYVAILVGGGIIVAYSSFGGIRAVTTTDVLQFIILIIAIPIICNVGLSKIGGIEVLFDSIPESHKIIFPKDHPLKYISLILIFSLPFLNPAITQRLLMAKSPFQIARAMRLSALIEIPFYIVIGIIGLIALSVAPDISPNMSIPFVINEMLPIGLKGLTIAGLIAVIMSTADSVLNSGAVAFVHDFLNPLMKNKLSDKSELKLTKIIALVLGCFAIFISMDAKSIVDTLLATFPFWSPITVVPLYAGLFNLSSSRKAFFSGAIAGGMTILTWEVFGLEKSLGFEGLIPAILANLTAFTLASSPKKIFLKFKQKPINERKIDPKTWKEFKYKILRNLNIKKIINNRVNEYGAAYVSFGIFSVINYILPYFMWTGETLDPLTIYLRTVAGIMAGLLIIKDSWPKRLQRHLPVYWFLTLMITLPFLSTYLLLVNEGSLWWTINMCLTIFLLAVLVDWLSFLTLLFLGLLLGSAFFFSINDSITIFAQKGTYAVSLYLYIFAASTGLIFSRRRELMVIEKQKSLKALAGTIAHEMRTPLSSIYNASTSMSESLKKLFPVISKANYEKAGVNKDYTLNIPERIQKMSRRSLANIDMLLGNIRNNVHQGTFQAISASEIVQEAIEDYPQDKSVSIKVCVEKDFTFYGEPQFFKQVLYNLIKNAVFAVKKRDEDKDLPGKIEIILQIKKGQGIIIVKDNGCGMTEMEKLKIFDKFFTTKDHGTGLGLTFCKNVIEAMRGTLKCETQENKGTSFIIHFPLKLVDR